MVFGLLALAAGAVACALADEAAQTALADSTSDKPMAAELIAFFIRHLIVKGGWLTRQPGCAGAV